MNRLLVVLPLLLVTACTTPAPAPSPTPPASSAPAPTVSPGPADGVAEVDCDHVIGVEEPTPDHGLEILLDAVALPTRRQLQVTESDGRWWAKQGLLVRPGVPVDIEIVGDDATQATIGWGNPGPESFHVRVDCPDPHDVPGWLAFAGGYTVDTPRCLPLRIRTATRETLAHIPVGAPC